MTAPASPNVEMHPYRRFSLAERDRRWKAIRELMVRDNLDAIVAPPNPGNSTDWQAEPATSRIAAAARTPRSAPSFR